MFEQKVDLKKIKAARKSNDISLERMAEILGYNSPNGYFYLESGKSKFTAEKLAKVSEFLGIPIDQLFIKYKVSDLETCDSEEVI
ncbi:helix-turn-helix domain-containing protein [Halobacillus sp. Marseille-Q1614]|uniref:helix-turn-helix domain-containing protein n=1 Tax=Halobacillus sp. Marseille-Q1614 TaxID=2709134 RepID=UPI0020C214E7|nr:helix-turn-helix transcriptional regulator [Halobacillus sp. Marseille-Q1614]